MNDREVTLKMESWKVWEILGKTDRAWQPIKFEGQGKGRINDVYKAWVYVRRDIIT